MVRTAKESSTLVELLRRRASHKRGRRAFTFLPDGENEGACLTYDELDCCARAIAAHLQMRGAVGCRVLLLYPSGLEFVAAFLGCLYAGAVAIPAYPPRLNRNLERLLAIVEDAQPAIALTSAAVFSRVEAALAPAGLAGLPWLVTDTMGADSASQWREPDIGEGSLAFLQYTSGSTSQPKGVMVSHGNLLANNRMLEQAFEQSENSTIVVWLPLFHDMGLIGNVLQSLFIGSECVLMPPEAFLVKPLRWLQAISRYRAHTSGGPNFAYDHCARRVVFEQDASLDLSCWQVAFNGSEPVRSETLEHFARTFAPYGFRREAFYPCYGLAEATLFVTGGSKRSEPVAAAFRADSLRNHEAVVATFEDQEARKLVSYGRGWMGQEIEIIDPETAMPCTTGTIGEIWVSGPCVALGYWNRPQETDRVFRARRVDNDEKLFLRTGDLGFFHEGGLFIAGRLKDLIIIAGRNHHPNDIEHTVERCHPLIRAGCCAAFSVEEEGWERLVILAELERGCRTAGANGHVSPDSVGMKFGTILRAIQQAVAEKHDLRADAVVFCRPASVPRTSSGKIQRHACRAGYLSGTLKVWE